MWDHTKLFSSDTIVNLGGWFEKNINVEYYKFKCFKFLF